MPDETISTEFKENDSDALVNELFSGKLPVEEALQRLRTRLLDLSSRNRLLNYRHTKGRSIQFVDAPNLNVLFHKLLDNKNISISPVPEPEPLVYVGRRPEAKQHAENHYGINTSYEFPLSSPSFPNVKKIPALQTLYYPPELEKLLRKIAREARAAIEETGTNMLFLISGFLEFYESDDSDKPLLAPLLSVPATLNRGEIDSHFRTYQYSLSYNGDDVSENLTLREKLRRDFLLNLPELDEEDEPETYFGKIQAAISTKQRWKVRRQLTLGMLFFGKLAIWADLDTSKWPGLSEHPLLKMIFEGRITGDGNYFAEDYNIDAHPRVDIPLVFDADSSQHSAIIDALSGKNIVINGPPGTGKSQTISNLIAIALSEGKTVLFVSEKLAALEVVHRRLTKAHLGSFCLELHSHKTQKKRLIEDVRERLEQRFTSPSGLDSKLNVLQSHKKELKRYAELMGSCMGNALGLTINEIFWAADRRRQELGEFASALHSVTIHKAGELTYDDIKQQRTKVEVLAKLYESTGNFKKGHPWWGFTPNILKPGDEEGVAEILLVAINEAEKLDNMANAYIVAVGGKRQPDTKVISVISKNLQKIPWLPERLQAQLLPRFCSSETKRLVTKNILTDLTNKITKVRVSLGYASSMLEAGHNLTIEEAQRVKESAGSMILPTVLATSITDVHACEASLNGSISSFKEMFSTVKPLNCPITGYSLADLEKKMVVLPLMNTDNITLTELESSAQAILKEHKVLLGAFEKVENILRKRNIPFDGSAQKIHELANSYGLEELHLRSSFNTEDMEHVRKTAGFVLAHLPLEELQNIYEKLHLLPLSLNEAFNRIKLTAQTVRLEFDGSLDAVENISTLSEIAKSCPHELVEHRRPSFGWPHMPELIESTETAISVELAMRKELEAVFYLDALPSVDDLKRSIRILRRKENIFCFFDGKWRSAKKLFRGIAKDRKKMKSSECADTLTKIVSWIEHKGELCSNRDFQDAFGSLFRGLETDVKKIRKLHDWYRQGLSELLKCPSLVNKIDLTLLETNTLGQLAASNKQIGSDVLILSRGSELIETTVGISIAPLNEAKLKRWPEYLEALQVFLEDLKDIINFLPHYTKPSVSPKRVLELMEARRELNEASGDISCLINGPQAIIKAGGESLGFRDLAEINMIRDSLGVVRETCNNILSLTKYLDSFVGGTCSPVSARDFMKAKLGLDLAVEKIAPWRSFFSWDDYAGHAKAVLNEVQNLLSYFSPNVRAEKSINEAFEAVSVETEAKVILKNLSEDEEIASFFGNSFAGVDTDLDALWQTCDWGSSVAELALPPQMHAWLLSPEVNDNLAKARQLFEGMSGSLWLLRENLARLERYGAFDWEEWQKQVRSEQEMDLPEEIKMRLEIAFENLGAVLPWSQYLAARSDCKGDSLESFPILLESQKISAALLPAAYELAVYQCIGKSIYLAFPELSRFTRIGHERTQANYQDLDREIIDLNGKALARKIDANKTVPVGRSGSRVRDLTEQQLLMHELNTTRHIPIRQLVKRAGRTLLALKPCFMMGPLSVAQYLEYGTVRFDLIVMDEASQLKPEEALGAVARGGQLIVVGDPKQLPPTSFFERLLEADSDDNEDDPPAIQGTESILDICQKIFYPMRTLRWHYRSHHESLIAFSNHYFYKNLIVFPSPYVKNANLGVRFHYIRNGIYSDRQNIPEAQRVTNAIMEHMLNHSDESLGVVTLNQTQRDLVEELLDKKLRTFEEGQSFLNRWEEEGWPFFVKNLENVQGDERDVIYISTTFGKAPGTDKPRQNFGPISRSNGWRRLNVLFTRSRKRIELFTSMMPEDIIMDNKTPDGTKALRNYLDFAKKGILPAFEPGRQDRDPDSDFEITVAEILRNKGYQVTPQLGVAGFFIDIAVHNPDRQGEFLAAIECDGATYHSGFSVRDRDRIRQEILESLGWNGRIWRIWSTDWFFNRAGAIKKLIDFLEQRRLLSQTEESFDYEVEEIEEEAVQQIPGGLEKGVLDALDLSEASDRFIEVGDRVTYYFVSNPKGKHIVHIVEGKSNPAMGVINEKTALAQALLGLSTGEENELAVPGQQNRTVRILRIQRV